tara:strand:+ start:1022 stop:1609 length:588 start_codon:yes stop_codon:yes gene_type:complete
MKPSLKWTAISIGGLIAITHIGVLGHLIRQPRRVVEVPTINIPRGTPYSSYKIEAGKEGYSIEYKANDPKVLESERSVDLVQTKNKKGFFGGSELFEDRNEYRRDQYTMEGVRNMGGASLPGEGKSAKDIECIVADAGARSQGAMAGSAITTGLVAPAVMNIPYIGWLAAGWATLLGNSAGESIGSQVGSVFNDC